ncbi:patatin [Flavobacterium cyanobacteriorum]|uniref:Patatin n=1 Tax=Flavobacterium cyanobacteriorum TaxID=2022802 RepID=A0A255YXK4_9FLAO|nr:patatin-like phospholipase family protein [Flavobacterium cyanobacteriorum]OYQ33963.1 patatin [Flavobacterium cyanobacteriorum]
MNKFLLLILSLLVVTAAAGQEAGEKPKIGLVLSGGGAKGLAHIGVLKVLEEAGIEISYIGGTSMGAIVGGLYASGYSAKELDSIFSSLDSDALLQDYTPRASKNFFEKRNDELYAITLPFNNYRLAVPTALSKGLYNYTTINRLTDHVRHIRDFDKLPIPFVCIATDIESGREVVLREGVLPDAILASGAFPSLYYPVEIRDRLLIDGGITNNYPVEEVKKMGADIIIGVDVQDGLKDRTQIKGATGVLVQINNYQMIQKMEAKRKLTDVYIKPDIKGFTVISFDEGRAIIDKGEEAAKVLLDSLKRLGSKNFVERHHIKVQDSVQVEYINITGLKNYTRSYVIGKLSFKPGQRISYQKFNEGISNLNATQNFNTISYNFTKGHKYDVLNLHLKENPVNRYLKLGLHYDGLYKSGALVNITQKKLFLRNDVASLDVILGDNFRYNFNYYLDNGFHISYGFYSGFTQFSRNVTASFVKGLAEGLPENNDVNVEFNDLTNRIYIQTIFAQRFMIGAGAEHKHLKIKSETVPDRSPVFEDSDYFSLYGYLKLDSYDDKFFPTEGWYFSGEARSFLYSTDYTGMFSRFSMLKADAGTAKTLFRNFVLVLQAETGLSIGDDSVPYFDFVLGGYGYHRINNFRHFYGYDFLSLGGNSYIKGAVTLDYELYRKNHINFTANFANIGDDLYEQGEILSIPQYNGYAIGYGLETLLGPVELKHSWSPETKDHLTWISVGFWF